MTWIESMLALPKRGWRDALLHPCRCGLPVITGLDWDFCAVPATVDLQAVNATGEAQALIEGRSSYDLRISTSRLYLRDRWTIPFRPAGSDRATRQLVTHDCTTPIPAAWWDTRDTYHQPATSEECPF